MSLYVAVRWVKLTAFARLGTHQTDFMGRDPPPNGPVSIAFPGVSPSPVYELHLYQLNIQLLEYSSQGRELF
ncbi:hypothetical protein [Photorhabdus aegyptia]|uniref:hypothetical protein n=2 Tax=Photorhabdus TaxID=29487 RepID=UPI001E4C7E1E|nr:hypothetical protein [Photorhabdus aegyptia]MCC8457967.1 hypothetical protein [Photorhabdus aegyptia]